MGRAQFGRTLASVLALATATIVGAGALVGTAFAATDSSGKLKMTKVNKVECDGTTPPGDAVKSSAVIKVTGGKDGKVTAEVTIDDGAKNARYDVSLRQSGPKASCGGKTDTVKTDKNGDAKITLTADRMAGRTGAYVTADGPGPILITKTFDYDGD
jgi:hypothetical protein